MNNKLEQQALVLEETEGQRENFLRYGLAEFLKHNRIVHVFELGNKSCVIVYESLNNDPQQPYRM